jgi:uncharacterized protein
LSTAIRAEEVAKYLKDNPAFFDEYAELLSSIRVPHPYGGHAIPLSERQVLTLRERGRTLEGKLRELVQFGEENDTISDRVHRISLALLAARDLRSLLEAVHQSLREDFGVPCAGLRLWSCAPRLAGAESEPVSNELRVFAESLSGPYFCSAPMFDSAGWFEPPGEALGSLAYVPLRARQTFGMLALGSPDPARFTQDMGTLYLVRLGELASAGLCRHLDLVDGG